MRLVRGTYLKHALYLSYRCISLYLFLQNPLLFSKYTRHIKLTILLNLQFILAAFVLVHKPLCAQTKMAYAIPSQMKAIRYNNIRDFELVKIPVPEPRPHEVLSKVLCFSCLLLGPVVRHYPVLQIWLTSLQVKSCGICGTDLHIHGEVDFLQ